MHIGSVILVIWLVIGGFAAGQRGDYKGPVNCSRAATAAITILVGPFNYTGLNPRINCTGAVSQKLAIARNPGEGGEFPGVSARPTSLAPGDRGGPRR